MPGAAGVAAPQTATLFTTNTWFYDAARAPDGSVGFLYSDIVDQFDHGEVRYYATDPYGIPMADTAVLFNGAPLHNVYAAALLLDNLDRPHVFLVSSFGLYHLVREGALWSQETLASDLYNFTYDGIACAGPGNTWHLLLTSYATNQLFHVHNRGGAWTQQVITIGSSATKFMMGAAIAVSADNVTHIAYSLQNRPSNDVYWTAELYYLHDRIGVWQQETVALRSSDSADTAFRDPSLAVTAAGVPAVAALLRYNVMTGSDSASQLFFTQRQAPGAWAATLVASTADNYSGSDGGNFTGWFPDLAFATNGAPHIIFSDLASSHIGGYEQAVIGQVRYAVYSGGQWNVTTLYPQSAANWQGLYAARLLLAPDGTSYDILARLRPSSAIVRLYTPKLAAPPFPWEIFLPAWR